MLGSMGVRATLGFDGAGNGRHEDWYSGAARPINSLTRRDGAKLRERSRDLSRNDLSAVSVVDKLSVAISGVRPRANTGDPTLNADIDTAPIKPVALAAGVGFQPGSAFSGPGGFRNSIRLSFAHYDEARIAEGVARLSAVIRTAIAGAGGA